MRIKKQTCDNFSMVWMVSLCENTNTNIQKFGSGNRGDDVADAADATSEVPAATLEPKTAELILPMKDPLMP